MGVGAAEYVYARTAFILDENPTLCLLLTHLKGEEAQAQAREEAVILFQYKSRRLQGFYPE